MRSVSVLSTHNMTYGEIDHLMNRLTAQRDETGWRLERNSKVLFVELGTDDMHITFTPEDLAAAGKLMNGRVASRLALIFNDDEDRFAFRMAVAVSKTVAELWPAVFDDHAGEMYVVDPPGQGLISS